MGGNLVLKLAGELGTDAPEELKAVAAVSPAADLAASADAMHVGGNRIYEWKFLLSLMRTYERKRKLFPEIYKKVERFPSTIREFDDVITARYCGFENEQDYYTRTAAARVMDKIAMPTLVVHAIADPFIGCAGNRRQNFGEPAHYPAGNRAWRPLRVSGPAQWIRWPLGGAPDRALFSASRYELMGMS
jgi:predicted alpha/beta-fold hydrolase